MLNDIRKILEMIRFSHTLFALPFALLATVMAYSIPLREGDPPRFHLIHLAGIVLCMIFARSAAMAFNRIVDRKIDAENPRTSNRHLPSGSLSLGSVVLFTVVTSVGFILSTLLFLPNWLPVACSVPMLLVLFLYSLTKRFTSLAHFWLGFSLMLAPLAAWIAIRGTEVIDYPGDLVTPCLLGGIVLFWVAGFDIIYACQDFDYDKRAKLKSIPVRLGIPGALRLAAGSHVVMILLLLALPFADSLGGPPTGLGTVYWVGVLALALLLIYEHSLVSSDNLTKVNIAFFNVNAVVSMGLFLVVSIDIFCL